MSLLAFFAIIIGVTGVVWLLQVLFRSNYRINVDLSITKIEQSDGPDKNKEQPLTAPPSGGTSVMGDAKTVVKRNLISVEVPGQQKIPKEATPKVESLPESSTQNGGNEALDENPDAYLNEVYKDTDLVTHTNESLLTIIGNDQLTPPLGYITFSGAGQIAAQLPPDSFEKPQDSEQVQLMFNLLQESIFRIENQMIAMYALQQAALFDNTSTGDKSDTDDEPGNSVNFGDDDDTAQFGGGFDQQLSKLVDNENNAPIYMSMEEAGVSVPDDAFQTYDISEASETTVEETESVEALAYMANLTVTGELAHEVVVAVKRKASTREVKHRVRQVLRALDQFKLANDYNAAVRVTAVMRGLEENLGVYDNDVAAIGRKFGIVAPENAPGPVEAD